MKHSKHRAEKFLKLSTKKNAGQKKNRKNISVTVSPISNISDDEELSSSSDLDLFNENEDSTKDDLFPVTFDSDSDSSDSDASSPSTDEDDCSIAYTSSEDESVDESNSRLHSIRTLSTSTLLTWKSDLTSSNEIIKWNYMKGILNSFNSVIHSFYDGKADNNSKNSLLTESSKSQKDKKSRKTSISLKYRNRMELEDLTDMNLLFEIVFVLLVPRLNYLLTGQELLIFSEDQITKRPTSSQLWSSVSPVMKSFLSNCILIIEESSLSSWQLPFILKSGLEGYYHYFFSFPKLLKNLVISLLKRWSVSAIMLSSTKNDDDKMPDDGDDRTTNISRKKKSKSVDTSEVGVDKSDPIDFEIPTLFLIHLRRIASLPYPNILHLIQKYSYVIFCKSMTDGASLKSLSHVPFLINGLLELWGPNQSHVGKMVMDHRYHLGFTFIRELALLIRMEIHEATEERLAKIVSWKFYFSSLFWTLLIIENHKKSPDDASSSLKLLLYPLIQILLEASCIHSSAQYYPFKFHCLDFLLRISQNCNILIPIEDQLIRMMESMQDKSKPSLKNLPKINFDVELKLPSSYINTKLYQDCLLDHAYYMLIRCLAHRARLISFPEYSFITCQRLKHLIKITKNVQLSKRLTEIVRKIIEQSVWICRFRKKPRFSIVDFASQGNIYMKKKDYIELENSPLIAYAKSILKKEAAKTRIGSN